MDIVYVPPLGKRAVFMRENFHFAEDDPMWYPQPFIPEIGFLSVMPKPPGEGSISAAFHNPVPDDFEPKDPGRPWMGIGQLQPALFSQVKLMVDELHSRYYASTLNNSPDEVGLLVKKTHRLCEYDVATQRLLQRLTFPSSRKICFTTLSILQRICLEFDACFKWVTEYRARCSQRNLRYDTLHVVGSFTDDLDIADTLFHAGIPVWVLHRVEELVKLRINAVVEPVSFQGFQGAMSLDVSGVQLQRPVIYTGDAMDLARYQCMSVYLKSLISTGVLSPARLPNNAPGRSTRSRSKPQPCQ
jgi:hypothetical protein